MTTSSRAAKRRQKCSKDAKRELPYAGAPRASNANISNALKQPQQRWQRAVRYTWDKNRGRG